jgi:predicted nucleic acid-binding protein
MLDTHVVDALLVEDAMLDALRWASDQGVLQIVVTHVQVDEILDTCKRDLDRAKLLIHTLLQVRAVEVSTYGAAWDHSRFGLSTWTDGETADALRALTGGNPAHTEDALIAATADHLGIPLVTDERRRTRFTRAFPSLRLLSGEDLRTIGLAILKARSARSTR